MIRFPLIFGAILAVLHPGWLCAEQEVTLKSGTRLIGTVTFEGDSVVVKIDDTELTVPLNNVELVAPVGIDSSQSPNRLLMIALESRLQQGSGEGLIGILAEAARLAPDNPRIAYWYASSLLDAGLGEAAQQVFNAQRDAIKKVYPGIAERLATSINDRVALAKLPPDLVSKIDKINSVIEGRSQDTDRVPTFSRFRLVDQHQKPIEKTDFRVQCNGSDEKLESFDAGYYLFSFNRYRNSSDVTCRLELASPGLESQQIELRNSSDRVEDAGDFVIHRYDENARLTFHLTVVDSKELPIAGATVTLRPTSNSNSSTENLTARTDSNGKVEVHAFPLSYIYTVERSGFNSSRGSIKIDPDSPPDEQRIELYPQITGKIRVAWKGTSLQPDGVATSGESTLELGTDVPGLSPYGREAVAFVRTEQTKDRLILHIGQQYFGGPPGVIPSWIHQVPLTTESSGESSSSSALEQYLALDLGNIEQLKLNSSPADLSRNRRGGPQTTMSLLIKQNQIYVGQTLDRNPQNGQPMMINFKIFVEELSNASP